MSLFPRVRVVPHRDPAEGRALLRFLLLRQRAVSVDAERRIVLLASLDNRTGASAAMTTAQRDVGRLAGGAGVIAATCAALCCAGAPIMISVLAATGLSFLRSDAILLPVIVVALVFATWGFWRSWHVHGSRVPLTLGVAGSLALLGGVIYLHGFLAKIFIGAGALLLLAATVWNARLPQTCDLPMRPTQLDA
jgi:hypothetical protein